MREDNKALNAALFAVTFVFFCLAFVLLFHKSMSKGLSSDEHQFVASAVLMAKQGLLPYRDFPFFHLPYLLSLYSLLFSFTDQFLFTGRLVSVAFAVLTLMLLFCWSWRIFQGRRRVVRFLVALFISGLLLQNELFVLAAGYAWNHTPSVFIALFAVYLFIRFYETKNIKYLFFSGFSLGLAVGLRLSFALMPVPLLLTLFVSRDDVAFKNSFRLAGAFLAGIFIGLIPVLVCLTAFTDKFLFGIIEYHHLNTQLRWNTGYAQAMDFGSKLIFLRHKIIKEPSQLILVMIFAAFLFRYVFAGASRKNWPFGNTLILITIPFISLGSFVPTPNFKQYYYAVVPFLLLFILYGMDSVYKQSDRRSFLAAVLLSAFLLSCFYGPFHPGVIPRAVSHIYHREQWEPVKIHTMGRRIAELIPGERVLTLAPIVPLEGGLDIYPEFSTGHGTWRTGHLIEPDRIEETDVVYPGNIDDFLGDDRPSFLTGFGDDVTVFEGAIAGFARANGYSPVKITENITLWRKGD